MTSSKPLIIDAVCVRPRVAKISFAKMDSGQRGVEIGQRVQ